jgi:adenine-specific DNA-methyltransferase
VVNGDKTGISKVEDWRGGGSFVYCELKQLNDVFIQKITDATTTEALLAIWKEIQKTGQISYKIKPEAFEANVTEFSALRIEDQKRFLLEVLDKNLLYVNYSEIDDTENLVTAADMQFNHLFYAGDQNA